MKKLIFTVLLSLSLAAQDQNIFYKDADIKTFAQDIALLTDKTIILDPRVKGVISIYSDAPLDSESIWEVFISTMEVQGYNVLKDGDIYRVIPSQEGIKNFTEDGNLQGSIDSEVIKLRFSSAKDIVNAVKPTRIRAPGGSFIWPYTNATLDSLKLFALITPDSFISSYKSFPSRVRSPTPPNTDTPPCALAILLVN